MKKITVYRKPSEADWTISRFSSDDNSISGFGVEDEHRDVKVKGETRIPNGVYDLGLRVSPRFSKEYYRDNDGNIIHHLKRTTTALKEKFHTQHELIWVLNVPNFEFILWHWGNTDDDTDGCYIVGTAIAKFSKQVGVSGSRSKYEKIYPLIWRAIRSGKVKVEYKDDNQ